MQSSEKSAGQRQINILRPISHNVAQRTISFGFQLVKDGNSQCLCVGDGSLLPVMAARAGFEKVSLNQCHKKIVFGNVGKAMVRVPLRRNLPSSTAGVNNLLRWDAIYKQ